MASANSYTAIYKKDGNFWIGWIEEVPGVHAQEKTKKQLLASLKTILQEALGKSVEEPPPDCSAAQRS